MDFLFEKKPVLPCILGGVAVGAIAAFTLAGRCNSKKCTTTSGKSWLTEGGTGPDSVKYSMADQPKRFATQKSEKCVRALDIDKIFDSALLKDKRVLITGTSRGVGLALVKEAVACGAKVIATCRKPGSQLAAIEGIQIIENIDVRNDSAMQRLVEEIKAPVDILINNAGYFKRECEKFIGNTMDFADQLMTIDICAVGILRVTNALFQAKLLQRGSKMAVISSQGGSVAWRAVQCPNGGDYGHHMSKAAANMAGILAANELRSEGIAVAILHPGFNRTDMTSKYKHIWDIEGAVDVSVGAKRVLHEINLTNIENSGRYINCEDGLAIPF